MKVENQKKVLTIYKYIPNMITCSRLVGTLAMLFTKPFGKLFFLLYILCGISDLLDGWIARATHTTSELGTKLDSAADLLFYFVMALKTFPALWEHLPLGVWIIVLCTVAIRLFSYLFVAITKKSFASLHTYLNKVTGFMVFIIPFYIRTSYVAFFSYLGCITAAVASLEELVIHLFCKQPRKSLLWPPLSDQ